MLGQLSFVEMVNKAGLQEWKSFGDKNHETGRQMVTVQRVSISSRLKSLLINHITLSIRCLTNCPTQKAAMEFIYGYDQSGVFAKVSRN